MQALRHLTTVTRRKLWFAGGFAVLFGVVDVLAQLVTGDETGWESVSWARAILWPIAAFALTWVMCSVLDQRGASRPASRPRILPLTIAAFAVPLVCWTVQYLHYWPLASMNDTAWILDSPIGAANQHPLSYNLALTALVTVGEFVGGTHFAGVVFASVVQMLLWAGLIAVVIRYLASIGTHRVALWLLIAYAALVPLIGNYSFALVKDSVFSMFLVALVPVLLHLRATRGGALRNPWFFAASVVALVGFAVMRNNGLVVLLFVLILVVLYAREARRLAWAFAAVSVVLALVPSVATSLKFDEAKSVEWVGVPLQQIGYTHAHNPGCIPAPQQEYFAGIMPADAWAEAWVPSSVDPTKDSPHFDRGALQEDLGAFVRAWFATGLACPGDFTAGYLTHTAQLWQIDAANAGRTGGQSYFTEAVSNHPANRDALISQYADRGIENRSLLPEPLQVTVGAAVEWGMKATPGAGTWFWLMLLTIAGFAYRRRGEWLALYAPSLLIWLTLLAAAPAVYPFRYVQFAMLVVPIGFAILLATRPIDDSPEPVANGTERGRKL